MYIIGHGWVLNMKMPNLKDPNDWLYAACSMVTAFLILVTAVVSLGYLIINAPSEWHLLDDGKGEVGSGMTVFCAIVYIACLALVIVDFVRRMKGCPREDVPKRYMHTSLGHTAVLFSIIAAVSITIVVLIDMLGLEITENFLDEMTNYEMVAGMLTAGPTEELIFRLGLIGLPMLLICAVMKRFSLKDCMGGFGMSWTAFALLVISAFLFGLAHLDGWSAMKIFDTFASGMFFGYIYIQHGIHVTIVAHSTFDLMASFEVFAGDLGMIPMLIALVMGYVLLIRAFVRIREYVPRENIHEPFDGTLFDMWDREDL